MSANHKIRLSTLLKTLIEDGYLVFREGNLKTTRMTDNLLELYKQSPTPLSQMSITFEDEE